MNNNEEEGLLPASDRDVFALRLIAGMLQGFALYLLLNAAHNRSGIATVAALFFPLLLVVLFIPTTLIIGLPRIKGARLLLWTAGLAVLVAALGYHDAWRSAGTPMSVMPSPAFGATPAPLPSFNVTFHGGVIVFIAFCLILANETARAWFAPYESYFEVSWKLGLQICLSALFVCALFLVLWLGAGLFMLLKMDFLMRLLRESWFRIPVCALAFSGALHITDVRPELIRGSRTLALSLLSWLLLVLVVIVGGFLASLPVTGLGLLWATRSATGILLGVAALTIVFVNAAFKGGPTSDQAPRVLRVCMRIACLMLPVLVMLAAYALALRMGQYGLTPRRVLACAGTFVAAFYAIGYGWAALARSDTLPKIAPVNVITAWVSIAVLVALFTALADPARLSVNSQVERLLSGRVPAEKFDYGMLRFGSARYGLSALDRLRGETEAANATAIRQLSAQAALKPVENHPRAGQYPDATTLATTIVSRSPGQPVPASFLSMDWKHTELNWTLPVCLQDASIKCDAYVIDLNGNHKRNVVLFPNSNVVLFPNSGVLGSVFEQSDDGSWRLVGRFSLAPDCDAVRDALSKGTFQLVAPHLQDIQVGGQRVEMQTMPRQGVKCSKVHQGAPDIHSQPQ